MKIMGHANKILVRATNWIGDAIMLTPAVTMLRERFPDAFITMCARPWVLPVFSENPCVDAVMPAESTGGPKSFKEILETARRIKKERFDICVIFPNSFSAAFIPWLAGIPHRIGYSTDLRAVLLTHAVSVPSWKGTRHEVFYYCNLADQVPGERTARDNEPQLVLEVSREALAWQQGFCNEYGIRDKDIVIGFNPGAAFGPAKCWPVEYFQRLGEMILNPDTFPGRRTWIAVLGTEKERQIGDAICALLGGAGINLCGRTDLSQVMAFIKRLDLLVTNDSGLMHVGAALSRPLVALFGSTNPVTTGPWSRNSHIVKNPVECAPCLKRSCPADFKCMKGITPEMVYHACLEKLQENVL